MKKKIGHIPCLNANMCVLYVLNSFQLLLTGNILCAFSAIAPSPEQKCVRGQGPEWCPRSQVHLLTIKYLTTLLWLSTTKQLNKLELTVHRPKPGGAGDFSALLLLIYLSERHITFAIVHLVVLTPFLVGQELNFLFLKVCVALPSRRAALP